MDFKAARESAGLTQEALAKQMNIARSTVAMWETGESIPRADKLPELAKIFGCTIDELFEERGEEDDRHESVAGEGY